jgi:hypothetical protein
MLYGDLISNTAHAVEGSESNKETVKSLISYVSFMAQHSKGIDINKIDLSKLSTVSIEGGKLKVNSINKTEINKLIFESCPIVEIPKIPAESISVISRFSEKNKQNKVNSLTNEIKSLSDDVKGLNLRIRRNFEAISLKSNEINRLLGNKESIWIDQVTKIQEAGFWKFESVNEYDKKIIFCTDHVWLEFNDSDAGINDRVNLGKFKLVFYIGDYLSYSVNRGGDNILVYEYYHPHLSGDSICLGNASGTMEKAIENNDLVTMAKICQLILTNYNPESPYVAFRHFKDEHNRRMALQMRKIEVSELLKHYAEKLSQEDEMDFIED